MWPNPQETADSVQRIWSHLLRKSLMENFIFCAVTPCSSVSIVTLKRWVPARKSLKEETK